MRSNQIALGSTNRRTESKLGLSPLPVEWLDGGCWRLPSGKALAEFALQAGFLAPVLLKTQGSGNTASDNRGASGAPRSKHFRRGGGR